MSAIFSAFGIDWRLLLVDTINFAILLGVLWYFLYTPLTRMLEERRNKVAQGVIDADLARKHLEEIERSRSETLSAAGKEADALLLQARKAAAQKEHELVTQADASAARIVADAQAQAREEKERAILESKQEVAKLIVLGIEKASARK